MSVAALLLVAASLGAVTARAQGDSGSDFPVVLAGAGADVGMLAGSGALLASGQDEPAVTVLALAMLFSTPTVVALTERAVAGRGDAASMIGRAYLWFAVGLGIMNVVFAAMRYGLVLDASTAHSASSSFIGCEKL